MTVLALIAPKLAALIPLLGSDKPGEVAATAAAITRQLAKAGADWHDLADTLTVQPVLFNADDTAQPPVFYDHLRACEWILQTDAGTRLSTRDREFVVDMQQKLHFWKASPKQATWLRAVILKLGGRWGG